MKKTLSVRTAVATTLAFALALDTAVYAAPPAGKFTRQAGVQVQFDRSRSFVPPEQLPTVDSDAALSAAEVQERLTAVAVTPNGEGYQAEITQEDLAIFTSAVSQVSAGYRGRSRAPRQASGAAAALEAEATAVGAESVIGVDQRVQVLTSAYPWSTVGRIDVGCTGTLIGPRHVLTAGHCVFNTATNQWYSNLNFTPGQIASAGGPFGTIPWSVAITTTGWTVNHDRNFDYAMIVVSSRIGNTVGWLGYGYDNNLPLYVVNINGYPGDKPFGTMWHSDCSLAIVQTYRLYYPCDTAGGMSGSAVYAFFGGNDRITYGIHGYGVDATGYNGATRITSTVFGNLSNWIAAYP